MTRVNTGRAFLVSLVLLAPLGCAQVIGIGDPDQCTDGTTYCDGVCADTLVDPENCGPRDRPEISCGNSCAGAACVDGSCVDTDCNREFAGCIAPASASSECHGLDCVEFAAATNPVCLRRCRSSDDCPFDYFCAPKGESAYGDGFAQYVLVGGHCVPSFCGGAPGTWYANGVANGGCKVGGEGYLRQGAVDDKAGTCLVSSANGVGVCVEAGRVDTSGACTFQPTGCVPRATYKGCKEGLVCLATSGAAEGVCYQVCDPKATGQCPAGMTCKDHSGGARTLGACEY